MKTFATLLLVAGIVSSSSDAFGDGLIVSETKLEALATEGSAGDRFGSHVAISGDTIVVGAYYVDGVNRNNMNDSSGAAYVFVRSGIGWIQQTKLTASDADSGDEFGYYVGSVASAGVRCAKNPLVARWSSKFCCERSQVGLTAGGKVAAVRV